MSMTQLQRRTRDDPAREGDICRQDLEEVFAAYGFATYNEALNKTLRMLLDAFSLEAPPEVPITLSEFRVVEEAGYLISEAQLAVEIKYLSERAKEAGSDSLYRSAQREVQAIHRKIKARMERMKGIAKEYARDFMETYCDVAFVAPNMEEVRFGVSMGRYEEPLIDRYLTDSDIDKFSDSDSGGAI